MGIAGFAGMALQRTGIACGGDGGVDLPGFGIAVAANHQRVDQGAHLAAIATGGVFDPLQMLGQLVQRAFDFGTAGAGGKHDVGVAGGEVESALDKLPEHLQRIKHAAQGYGRQVRTLINPQIRRAHV